MTSLQFHAKAMTGHQPYEQRAMIAVHSPQAASRLAKDFDRTLRRSVTLPCQKEHESRFYTDQHIRDCANFVRANTMLPLPAIPSVCVPRRDAMAEAMVRGGHTLTEASFDSSRAYGFEMRKQMTPTPTAAYLFKTNQIVWGADKNAEYFQSPTHLIGLIKGTLVHEMVHAAQASAHPRLFELADAHNDKGISLLNEAPMREDGLRYFLELRRHDRKDSDEGLILLEGHATFIQSCADFFFSMNRGNLARTASIPLATIYECGPSALPRNSPHVLGFYLVCRIKALQAELEDEGWLNEHGQRYKLGPSLCGDGLLTYLYEHVELIDQLLPYRHSWFAFLRERIHLNFFRRLIIALPGHVQA